MNLRAKPYKIDFIGNDPKFVIKTSPFLTEGRRYARSFAVPAIANSSFDLHTQNGDFHWTVSAINKPDNPFAMLAANNVNDVMNQLQAKLVNNYDLNIFYTISIQQRQNDVLLTFTANDYGPQDAIVLSNNANPYNVVSTTTGLAQNRKGNYKIAAWFRCGDQRTPGMFYDANDNDVAIGTAMLQPYMSEPDIPDFEEIVGTKSCPHAAIRTRLYFAESEKGQVGVVKQSDEIMLLRGKIEQYCADNNIPDWESNTDGKLSRSTGLGIFGQDNGDTVKTDLLTEQYLYVANFTAADIANVPVTLTTRADDGTTTTTAATVTFKAMEISRVAVGASALGIASKSGLAHYSVTIGNTGITRHFLITPRPFHAKTALLQNHVGLYESFVFYNVAVEITTNGERAVTNRADRYIIDDTTRVITARTGQRTEKEIRRLEKALANEHNLLLDGQYAWRISIVPGSYIVVDETADLIEVEMQFLLTEKVNRQPLYISSVEPSTVISRTDNIIKQTQSR